MDLWFLSKIALCLLAAALFGLLIGWLLWARSRRLWRQRANETYDSLQSTESRLAESSAHTTGLDAKLAEYQDQHRELNTMLAERSSSIVDLEAELVDARTKIDVAELTAAAVRKDVAELESSQASLEAELTSKEGELAAVSAQLSDNHEQIRQLKAELATQNSRVAELGDELAGRVARVRELEPLLAERESLLGSLDSQVVAFQATATQLEGRLSERDLHVEALEAEKEAHDGRIADLEAELSRGAEHLAGLEARLATAEQESGRLQSSARLVEGLQEQIAKREARVAALEKELNQARQTVDERALPQPELAAATATPAGRGVTAVGVPAADHTDDLKAIFGIGPKMEQTLNRLGITSWEQIAGFTKEDIGRVAAAIDTFPDRIERDDWKGGAQRLLPHGTEHAGKKPRPMTKVGVPAATEQDDLKLIFGIGPVLEKTLNRLGIQSYRQIANFTKADIGRVAAAIDTFPDRIERDDWKGGARAEFKKKYGARAKLTG